MIKHLQNYDRKIEEHLARILAQLQKGSDRFGIGEADPQQPKDDWSPPNAFHTYWTLDILSQLQQKFPDEYKRIAKNSTLDLERKRQGMLVWTHERLGYEISLHSEPKSSVLDTDQLAWALAIYLRFGKNFHSDLAQQDVIKQAFKCLFSTQTDVGTWPHYKPLFHYRDAGNAYCYVFETFAVLLQWALTERAEAEVVRELLKPYCKNLVDLWRYALSTQIPLQSDSKILGWSSGHRINKPGVAESWATASVFSYAQALRRLIGIWCREEALRPLSQPKKEHTQDEAATLMMLRGRTWGRGRTSVSDRLWTMFINPVRMCEVPDTLEPDHRPVRENHARSAILFGPPGTSKTTLVRLLADAIGWKYVELHASHFVAQGLAEVQKTADDIFKRLLELDHAVVLFDEIDELVRERDIEKDAFGRFLTTSMLPKLAQLWDARKILYFVATNHINYFDSAIIRSHRFDALIFVSPPSFASKIEELQGLLSEVYGLPKIHLELQQRDVDKSLKAIGDPQVPGNLSARERRGWIVDWRERKIVVEHMLAKFALLRWDELNELAYRLSEDLRRLRRIPRRLSTDIFVHALAQIADSEWRKNKSYQDYLRDTGAERRDYHMLNVWEFRGRLKKEISELVPANHSLWLAKAVDYLTDVSIPGYSLHSKPNGRVEIRSLRKRQKPMFRQITRKRAPR